MFMSIATLGAAGLVGFAVGLFSFQVKSRWCPKCGTWTYRRPPAADHQPHTAR